MSETFLEIQVRPGTYLDSVVLMRVQRGLAESDGVSEAAALMGTPANRELLRESGLDGDEAATARPDDLVLAVRAISADAARAALARVDELLVRERPGGEASEYRFRSLSAALADRASARWVLISVPGRWAPPLVEQALEAGRHVFLYSDNVELADEVRLKQEASRRGLLLLGPDCGTARIGGVGLGFANRTRAGTVGVVAASGTGLQALMADLHARGAGISQAIGVGGRDLRPEVGGLSSAGALEVLARDPSTRTIVLVSKPPSPEVGARLLARARRSGKPVVACFQGFAASVARLGNVHFARGLDEAARLAVELDGGDCVPSASSLAPPLAPAGGRRWLRGLFAGGTLAQELQLALRAGIHPLVSNVPVEGVELLEDPRTTRSHCIVDLGVDELTAGRPHPLLDPDSRADRLRAELDDPETAVVVLDVVLGDGCHEEPVEALARAVESRTGDAPTVLVWWVGTDLDPQDGEAAQDRLEKAGIGVYRDLQGLAEAILAWLPATPEEELPPIDPSAFEAPLEAINVGLESFAVAVEAQEGRVVRVDWKPPAGGDDRLAGILSRMRRKTT